ncbi:MAG: substrate-binding domain-containing protein [Firmicutes bacterium]|nr:substrate-binding domain-containing protein [Bacillota bacterium]
MRKIRKDIDNIFGEIIDEDVNLPQSALNIIAKLPPKNELKKAETKTQKAVFSKFIRAAALAMACVLFCGAIIGGYFLFRDGNDSAAEQAFSNAISKMSQQDCLNINDIENQSTYVYEKGTMVSIYSSDEDIEQWLNKDGSVKKESGLYFKDNSVDKSKLSQNIKSLLLEGNNADSYRFGDADNIIIVKSQDTDYLVALENGIIESVMEKDEANKKITCNVEKNNNYYAPGAIISIFIGNEDDAYVSLITNELQSILAANLAIETVNIFAAGWDQATQIKQIEYATERGVDLLVVRVVNAWDENTVEDIMNLAGDAGISVIFFNNEMPQLSTILNNLTCYVGLEVAGAGVKQGQMIAEFLLTPENITNGASNYASSDGKSIKYAMVVGMINNLESFHRTLYSIRTAQAILSANEISEEWVLVNASTGGPGWETPPAYWWDIMVDVAGNPLSDDDKAIFNGYIAGYVGSNVWNKYIAADNFFMAFTPSDLTDLNKLGIIISNDDYMVFEIMKTLQELNLNNGSETIPLFGIDGHPDAVEAIDKGFMTGTVYNDTSEHAEAIAKIILNILAKRELLEGTGYEFAGGTNKLYIPYRIYIGL